MLKRIRWSFFAVLAVGIGLYPVVYFLTNQKMGLLTSKSDDLLSAPLWNLYTLSLHDALPIDRKSVV